MQVFSRLVTVCCHCRHTAQVTRVNDQVEVDGGVLQFTALKCCSLQDVVVAT